MSFQNDRSSIISKRGLIVWSPYDEGETEAGSGIEKGIGSQRLPQISSAKYAQQDDHKNGDIFVNLHLFSPFENFLSEGVVFFRKNAYIINRIFICEGVIQRERKPWYIRRFVLPSGAFATGCTYLRIGAIFICTKQQNSVCSGETHLSGPHTGLHIS